MKVLYIVPTLGYGGIANVVMNYYSVLKHKRYKIDFITHGKKEEYHSMIEEDGNKVFYFETIGKRGLIQYVYNLKGILKTNKYDVVHIHTEYLAGITGIIIRILGYKNKIICHAHSTNIDNKRIKSLINIWRFLSAVVSNDRIACSKEAALFYFGTIEHVEVIYNPIEYKKFTRKHVHFKKDDHYDLIIGHVGAFVPVKNHIFLIDIFEELINKGLNTKLILVGDGILKVQIEEYINRKRLSQNIILLGNIDNVDEVINDFDVFVFPSKYEGLGIAVLEAQAAGKACLISDTIPKEVDLNLGLVEFKSLEVGSSEWADAILKMDKNCEIDNNKIHSAFIEKGYDISTVMKKIETLYGR